MWIAQGRLHEAWDWAREQRLAVDDNLSYLREFEHITLARLLLAHYHSSAEAQPITEVHALLARLLTAADAGERMGSAIELLLLQALAYQAQGDTPSALVPLDRALALAEPEGYLRLFVDEGQPLAQLLSAAAAQGLRPAYVGKLLAALGAADPPRTDGAPPLSPSPAQPLVEPLTDREVEVLALIAEGLTNQEIGAPLPCPGHGQRAQPAYFRQARRQTADRGGRQSVRLICCRPSGETVGQWTVGQ
ncbi:MAG: LuxR C-terminal-related transcriptional regulator [Caldilineaceae bacterium]